MATRATDKPTVRIVTTDAKFGTLTDMVAEVRDRTVTLRPARTKRGGLAEVVVTWGSIYDRALVRRVEPLPSRTRRP